VEATKTSLGKGQSVLKSPSFFKNIYSSPSGIKHKITVY